MKATRNTIRFMLEHISFMCHRQVITWIHRRQMREELESKLGKDQCNDAAVKQTLTIQVVAVDNEHTI